ERKGDRTLLVTTKGFGDALRIGYQNRPRLFDLNIQLPELLHERVIEVEERISAQGEVLQSLDEQQAHLAMQDAFDEGFKSVAIVLMHGYRYAAHEVRLKDIALALGFSQVSVSHEVSPLMKLVGRGDTTVLDAYLSPVLRRYVDQVAAEVQDTRLMFMQSNGGLTDAWKFQGKDAILSGPAGGVVGMVNTARAAGLHKLIGFDMGGTSTDVSHYAGEFERAFETQISGVRIRAPMMRIHTVAAGGGSILTFDGSRYRVGPESAAANPGPACYRRGGPLTVTDCNVMLGTIQPDHFPQVFGPGANQPLDGAVARAGFAELAERIGDGRTPEQVADGFLTIAIENMANAIKEISVQRGYDVTEYALCCFGGAGGQHACLVADSLGIESVFIHPFAGVLSAYGMGLADTRALREETIEVRLSEEALSELEIRYRAMENDALRELLDQDLQEAAVTYIRGVHVRYEGTDTALPVVSGDLATITQAFEDSHRQHFGFADRGRTLVVETITVEAISAAASVKDEALQPERRPGPLPIAGQYPVWMNGARHDTSFFDRQQLCPGDRVEGPAVISEPVATTVVEPGWTAEVTRLNHLLLRRTKPLPARTAIGTDADPVMLEVFNNLFMSIAEQMGTTLANTAYSVNVKERLDFSCAIFDAAGNLVANAPHMPVHLGSMSESVRAIIEGNLGQMQPGDVYALNSPYNGGTHLPDVTVITPVFDDAGKQILFYVGSRGHHADIGGITPGSMPPHSTHVDEEGVLIDNFKLVGSGGVFHEKAFRDLLASASQPARNPDNNVADIKAQIAANEKGVHELLKMIGHFGLEVVHAYMGHVQDNAEESVRRVIDRLDSGEFSYTMDGGHIIKVAVSIDSRSRSACVDFSGTSNQLSSNFNAPSSVARAAVLYVFRTLVADDIPMNEGCLKPIDIVIPAGCMLNPDYPAAVVAGNVETSQAMTDALFGALGVMAAAQGTMNNLTFGNDIYQYYETVCGGSGGGPDFDGTDAVHTHMTNSRMTDPEVLEWRFPVLLEDFHIRRGSGGRGRHSGGDGVVRRLRFLEDMQASILSDHRRIPPFGLAGGEPGMTGRNYFEGADGSTKELAGTDTVEIRRGDSLIVETPGGGGYGSVS
ncbi:MAG: 5-oxoprolinase, partial [Gammaproteobacteria bacterium]|nr:5-oxoprolinase [Gammaproteobacteria bacterium]